MFLLCVTTGCGNKKAEEKKVTLDNCVLMETTKDSTTAFWRYMNKIKNIIFEDSIKNIEILDTSNVTNMGAMFSYTGKKSEVFKLDFSNWNVDNVTHHGGFNQDVEDKVTPPVWVK